jgi:hypothetical protein
MPEDGKAPSFTDQKYQCLGVENSSVRDRSVGVRLSPMVWKGKECLGFVQCAVSLREVVPL